jgi:NHS family xanthosine MFS transporter
MGIKQRLILMNFLQFFIWGSWLLTIGKYCDNTMHWSYTEFGAIFSTMGIASLLMPALAGIIADRWVNAERLYGLFHIMAAVVLFTIPLVRDPTTMFWVMLLNMALYMPTISLSITVAYTSLKGENKDIIKEYPPIRVWGTIGFIVALWTISLMGLGALAAQFYVAAVASFILGIYAITMPKCPPLGKGHKISLVESLGLNAFSLFKSSKMALFFIFAMFLGASLQLTNAYGANFLDDFAKIDIYKDLLSVRYPEIIMSVSQISETLFILTIPFFMKRFGIKKVMLFSMIAWVLRFGLLSFGNPAEGLWMILLSCIIYGMAFDFFNISGSLFVETQSKPEIKASAQGLFMMMTNGFGAILGSVLSGLIIERFFRHDGISDWSGIWLAFAGYSVVVAILFAIFFRHKHDPKSFSTVPKH